MRASFQLPNKWLTENSNRINEMKILKQPKPKQT